MESWSEPHLNYLETDLNKESIELFMGALVTSILVEITLGVFGLEGII